MMFADAGSGSAKHEDFSTANSGRNRNAPESLFSFAQRLWHRHSLTQGSGLEKEYLAEKPKCGGERSQNRTNEAWTTAREQVAALSQSIQGDARQNRLKPRVYF